MYELKAEELGPEFFQSAKQKLYALPRHAWGSPKTNDFDLLALAEFVAKLLSENYALRREAYHAKQGATLVGDETPQPLSAGKLAAFGYEGDETPASTALSRPEKLAKVSDFTLLQFAGEVEPGSDAHYDAIMEICNRGLKDPEAGVTACNYLPEQKANLQSRPRLGPSNPGAAASLVVEKGPAA